MQATIAEADLRPDDSAEELIRKSLDGDSRAFEALYRAHVGRVYALCLRLSADPHLAGELTQDVFVRAWSALGSFRGEAAFGSWLHRLAVNVVRQRQRSDGGRRRRIEGRAELEEFANALGALDEDARIDLERAIATLPGRARHALVLHDIYGYRCREVAEMMGTAIGTAQAHLHRARKLLREALDK